MATRDVRVFGRDLNVGFIAAAQHLSPLGERPEPLLCRDVRHDEIRGRGHQGAPQSAARGRAFPASRDGWPYLQSRRCAPKAGANTIREASIRTNENKKLRQAAASDSVSWGRPLAGHRNSPLRWAQ